MRERTSSTRPRFCEPGPDFAQVDQPRGAEVSDKLRFVATARTRCAGWRIHRVASSCGDVAQLVRALPCHGRGRGFEPRRPRHTFQMSCSELAELNRGAKELQNCAAFAPRFSPSIKRVVPLCGPELSSIDIPNGFERYLDFAARSDLLVCSCLRFRMEKRSMPIRQAESPVRRWEEEG